ncbi:MAG TPA: ATP-binding protein [Opitutus sp.]|nr:ATP-binding protein [Opitutus sp.]
MDDLHGLLRRQLQRHVGRGSELPGEWQPLLRAVSEAYREFDVARRLVERALELSSAELHAANAELRGVLSVLPDRLFRVRSDGGITGVMAGSPVDQHPVLQRAGAEPASEAGAFRRDFWRAVETVRTTHTPVALDTSCDGAHFEVRLFPFVGSDIIGIVRDITARHHAERDRLVLGKLESTGILAGGIAHDFNNLLAAILLNVQLAGMPDLSPEKVAKHLAEAGSTIHAAKLLTQQLLAFARGGVGASEALDLASVVREAAPLVVTGSSVRCEIVVANDVPPIRGDRAQLGQMIRHLVLNAREAMPDGGTIVVRLDSANTSEGPRVHLTVTDQGSGIPASVLPRIFDPYFSTKMRGTQKGMGLGLTICHVIVQRHGGAISVESHAGAGATFHVYFPAVAAEEAAPARPAESAPASAASRRILVMDDEPMVRTVMEAVLTRLGYETAGTENGRDAVALYLSEKEAGRPFAAVILDLTVKGDMGGEAAVRELLKTDPDVRAIVMSGYSDSDVMRDYARHGFKASLAKPCDHAAIVSALRSVLGAG